MDSGPTTGVSSSARGAPHAVTWPRTACMPSTMSRKEMVRPGTRPGGINSGGLKPNRTLEKFGLQAIGQEHEPHAHEPANSPTQHAGDCRRRQVEWNVQSHAQHNATQRGTTRHNAAQRNTTRHDAAQRGTTRLGTARGTWHAVPSEGVLHLGCDVRRTQTAGDTNEQHSRALWRVSWNQTLQVSDGLVRVILRILLRTHSSQTHETPGVGRQRSPRQRTAPVGRVHKPARGTALRLLQQSGT
jgi:hypothetical protein